MRPRAHERPCPRRPDREIGGSMNFESLIERMADGHRDWACLDKDERLELVEAHMKHATDEYASEALSVEDVRQLAKFVASMDEQLIGRWVLTRWVAYA